MKFEISQRGDFALVELFGAPSIRDLLRCAQCCERFQAAQPATRDWMIDLTPVRGLQIGLYEMNVIARRFNSAAHAGLIRCAMVAQSQPEVGGARRLRTLHGRREIEIELFLSSAEALQWLSSRTRSKHGMNDARNATPDSPIRSRPLR